MPAECKPRSIGCRPPMSDETPIPRVPSGTTSPTRAPTSTRRAVLNTMRGSAGNLVEWYDVDVYTVFASYFEAQFFDKNDTNSTVYIYAIFAVTFVMRPVGSWFFGRYADRRGRKAALMLSWCRDSPPVASTAHRRPTCPKQPPRIGAASCRRFSTSP